MLPEVMEICDVSDDLLEWPLWQERELSDLASVSINLKSGEGKERLMHWSGNSEHSQF